LIWSTISCNAAPYAVSVGDVLARSAPITMSAGRFAPEFTAQPAVVATIAADAMTDAAKRRDNLTGCLLISYGR
jgi:hypothetical protein